MKVAVFNLVFTLCLVQAQIGRYTYIPLREGRTKVGRRLNHPRPPYHWPQPTWVPAPTDTPATTEATRSPGAPGASEVEPKPPTKTPASHTESAKSTPIKSPAFKPTEKPVVPTTGSPPQPIASDVDKLPETCPEFVSKTPSTCDPNEPFRSIDGSCNNLGHAAWGQSKTPLDRFLPAEYGTHQGTIRKNAESLNPLPSARAVTQVVIPLARQPDDVSPVHTQMNMLFGQFIDHDLSHTPLTPKVQCCSLEEEDRPESCIPIAIPINDSFWATEGKTCMELRRSSSVEPGLCGNEFREQMNNITAFIDAGLVYGSTEERAKKLREFVGGKLKYSNGDLLPHNDPGATCNIPADSPTKTCYMAGDNRVNVWPGLTALHLTFHREHNRVADILATQLRRQNPQMDAATLDELVYQQARRVIGAELQVITYKEYLPKVLGPDAMREFGLDLNLPYKYDPKMNPKITNSFATAAFRFGHAQIPFGTQPKDRSFEVVGKFIEYSEMFNNPAAYNEMKQDNIIRGVCSEPGLKDDNRFADEVRDKLFAKTFNGSGLDLAAVNAQRGRDHGLPPYTKYREWCGLSTPKAFDELVDHSKNVKETLSIAYESVNDIDLFIGGITEINAKGATVGPTFQCIIGRQFEKVKYGDRFWFQSQGTYPNSFTANQIRELSKASLSKIICDNHDMPTAPLDSFELSNSQLCKDAPHVDLTTWLTDVA